MKLLDVDTFLSNTTTIEYVTLIKVLWKSALIVVSSGGAPNVSVYVWNG